jgi:hypothetical protein
VRVAAAAFVAAAIFLGGVMVGLGSGDDGDREAPVAIALVDEGTTATPHATPRAQSNVKKVEHPAKQGEVDENSGPGGGEAEYWEEDNSGPGSDDDTADDSSGPGSGDDSSGPGSGDDSSGPGSGDDSSGPGSGGDDNSGSGSSSSGSGSDGSGDSSGPG